jgi:hypothetical protein
LRRPCAWQNRSLTAGAGDEFQGRRIIVSGLERVLFTEHRLAN